MKKSELLNWLQEKHQQWEALLDQIGQARMDQPGDKWNTAKAGQYGLPNLSHR